jgi:hypothetical protein
MHTRRLASIAAILVAGCATSTPPANVSSAGNAGRPTEYRRCSAADPDRFAWFCVIGQIIYATIAVMQSDPGPGPR